MINKTYKSLSQSWEISVPATVQEVTSLAGSEQVVIDAVNDKIVYHNTLTGLRSDASEVVAKVTGIAMKTKAGPVKKDGTSSLVSDESDETFIERATTTAGQTFESILALDSLTSLPEELLKALPEGFTGTVKDAIIALNPYSIKPRTRAAAGPKGPTKGDLVQADAVIAAGQADAVVAMLTKLVGGTIGTDRESIARAYGIFRRAEEAKASAAVAAQMAAMLGGK